VRWGAGNAAFDLMRTFRFGAAGRCRGGRVSRWAGIPFVTCSSPRYSTVFDCTGNSPTWHLTGAVIAAGLSGASLVLARTAARAQEYDRLTNIERRLAELQRDQGVRRPDEPAGRTTSWTTRRIGNTPVAARANMRVARLDRMDDDPTPTWRLRVELTDRPGTLARLATSLAGKGCNILALTVLPVPDGVIDGPDRQHTGRPAAGRTRRAGPLGRRPLRRHREGPR